MDVRSRTLPAALLTLAALAFSGCVTISSTSSSQPQSLGTVKLTVYGCATGAPGCSGPSNSGSAYGALDSLDSDQTTPTQLLLAVRLPAGVTPPAQLTAALGGGSLAFARSTSYETELQALEPAPAGEQWWGWLSATFSYGRKTAQSFSVVMDVTPPHSATEEPYVSPMRWRPVVGGRYAEAGMVATRPVECGNSNAELYNGHAEGGGGSVTVVCIDSPTADAARGYLEAAIVDFGFTGTSVTAPAGSTVTATLIAKRSGIADTATNFALAAAGGPPGGTVVLDRASVPLGGDAAIPVLATVTIPPGTAPGSYPVTVTATAAGKPARTGTAIVVVPAPAPAATPVPTPAPTVTAPRDTTAPLIRKASLKKRRLTIDVSEAAKLTVTFTRKGAKAQTWTKTLRAGSSRLKLPSKFAKRKGRYTVRLSATDAAGNRSKVKSLKLKV